MKTVPPEQRELLQGFVAESMDALDDNENLINKLSEEDNQEDLKSIFRVFHTLKGLSGFFELMIINKTTHEAETLLDIFRQDPKPLNDETIDLLYSVFDFLRNAIAIVGQEFSDETYAEKSKSVIEQIRAKIEEISKSTKTIEKVEIAPPPIKLDIAMGEPAIMQSDDETSRTLLSLKKAVSWLENSPDQVKISSEALELAHKIQENLTEAATIELKEILGGMMSILESIEKGIIGADSTVVNVLSSDVRIIARLLGAELSSSENNTVSVNDSNNTISNISSAPVEAPPEIPEIKNEALQTPIIENAIPKIENVTENKSIEKKVEHKPELKTENQEQKLERKDIRVSTDKLNKLFDLVGEIITIESMVVYNKDLTGLHLPNFSQAANMLNKLTRELQAITMTIRMMPLEGLFNKMSRLVRDLSRKFGKKVDLQISGQETEMDKNVIEEISDPLVHIIRNSIDHGLETGEERKSKGKPETGSLLLGAGYYGNEINIFIEDDGAGINTEKVLKKAIERGSITIEEAGQMTDKDICYLIFEAGLSTAKEVTDVSGRGVGMDVVRRNIEKLHGSIDIESARGKGTRITLRIPLTLAIMDAMLVRVGAAKYAVPMLSIQESFRPKISDITKTMDGVEVVKVRSELFPVIRLYELMNRKPDHEQLEDGILMMLSSRGKKACLFVDEILGQQQAVVKGLSDYIGEVKGVTGCMVMADGKIGLILDVDSLIDKAEEYKG